MLPKFKRKKNFQLRILDSSKSSIKYESKDIFRISHPEKLPPTYSFPEFSTRTKEEKRWDQETKDLKDRREVEGSPRLQMQSSLEKMQEEEGQVGSPEKPECPICLTTFRGVFITLSESLRMN